MITDLQSSRRIPGYCAQCVSRCGAVAVVDQGQFVALEPDPSHPTGAALCAKGRAGPELVYHPDRLLYPLQRTRPKGAADPGWQRISWDEALDRTATALRTFATADGPESVVFSVASPSTSASDDSAVWIQRLMNVFGSPNLCASMELCGWGRFQATQYTFGASVPGAYMPDLAQAGCILFWGYNPNVARLAHATATAAALHRGARLIVVDPRRTGPAQKADVWFRVQPGTDGALALGIAQVMLARGWYDRDFIREWTNGPLLVRLDNGRLLRQSELAPGGSDQHYVAWSETLRGPIDYDPAVGRYDPATASPTLMGTWTLETLDGPVRCQPVFARMVELCERYPPERVAAICGVGADLIVRAARLLWDARPVAYYAWSGVEMQSNATQIARAIAQLYTLTGCFDAPGGNVLFPSVPAANVAGHDMRPAGALAPALGRAARPLGPSRWNFVTTDEVYRAILEQQPYPVRALVGFGANLLLAHADVERGHQALAALPFYVHADLFMSPTAEQADIILPVASCFERDALKLGFEGSLEGQSLVQWRAPIVAPRGEARSDTRIIFDLACRLGLGAHFWDGDIEAAYRYQLEPSGITLDRLQADGRGVRVPLATRYRKYAEQTDGTARGFQTPTRKVELYSETLLSHGYPPLPDYEAPLASAAARPELVAQFPLILTSAKHTLFCESQHRALPSLRRRARDPEIELHPAAAAERGIGPGDWVTIETPLGRVRARARLNATLAPNVVCGQHGWWQACPELGLAGYPAFGADSANLNLVIGNDAIDPVSGSVPHRAYLCQIRREE